MKKFFSIIFLTTILNSYGNIEVIEISRNNTDNLPGGKEADGIIGDFVLRNNFIECVISGPAPNRKANMGAFWGPSGVTPGCLYDLCIRGSNNDQLTIFSPSRQRGNISYVKPGDDNQSIITHISKAVSGGLTKRHTYSLEKNEYGLTITSQLLNETKEKISGPITDTWTRFRKSGRFEQVEWADSVDPSDKCGYAYTWLMDEQGKTPPKSKTFSQGTEIVVQRYLAVGNSPIQAYGRVMQKVGQVGSLLIKLTDSNRKEISTARLNFEKEGKSIPGYPDEKGVLDLFLPF